MNRYLCGYEDAYRRCGGVDVYGRRSSEEDEPEIARVAREIAIRSGVMVAHGWKESAWKPTTPGSPIFHRDQRRHGAWLHPGSWFDHPYRLTNRRQMRTVYVVEPYGVEVDDDFLRAVETVGEAGWTVTIKPERTLHYPGATVAIWFERPRKNPS